MEQNDILYGAASLAVILFLILAGIIAAVVLFTVGSPLVLLGSLFALGAIGFVVLFGILAAVVSVWYILYALMKGTFSPDEEKPAGGNYSLGRIRKAGPRL